MDGELYIGIDPGKQGGAGVVSSDGTYVFSWRWPEKSPRDAFLALEHYHHLVKGAYIEEITFFRQRSKTQMHGGQELIRNAGMWEGWLLALQITYGRVTPSTWLSAYKLREWRQRKLAQATMGLPDVEVLDVSPLGLARVMWPEAPLQYQADDGRAVGLLLAELARNDDQHGKFKDIELVRATRRHDLIRGKGKGQVRTGSKRLAQAGPAR